MMDPKQRYKEYMDAIEPTTDFLAKLKHLSADAKDEPEIKNSRDDVVSDHKNRLSKERQNASPERHKVKTFPTWARITAACLGVAVGIFAWTFMRDTFHTNKSEESTLPEHKAFSRSIDEKGGHVDYSDDDSDKMSADSSEQNDSDEAAIMPCSYHPEMIRNDARQFIHTVMARTEDELDWDQISNVEIESTLFDQQTAADFAEEINAVLKEQKYEQPTTEAYGDTVSIEITKKEPNGDVPSDSIYLANDPVSVTIYVSGQTISIP